MTILQITNNDSQLLIELFRAVGFWNFLGFVFIISIGFSVPSIISIIKNRLKKKEEEDLYNVLRELASHIKVLVQQYSDSISYEQAQILVTSLFEIQRIQIDKFISDILNKNNLIENRRGIENRLRLEIGTEFDRIKDKLTLFDYKAKNLASFMQDSWRNDMYEVCISILYDDKLDYEKRKSNLSEYFINTIDCLAFEFLRKLKKIQ